MSSIKVEDRLDGASNYYSWKSRELIALEENDLLNFATEGVSELEGDSEKTQWKKNIPRQGGY